MKEQQREQQQQRLEEHIREEHKEELANSLTHGFGLLLCVVAIPVLMFCTASKGGAMNILSSAVFSFSLLMVYASSTLYHSISIPGIKSKLRILDHVCIYFLIAGSYTPFIVIALNKGFLLLIIMWIMVALGTLFKLLVQIDKAEIVSVVSYVIMGWAGVIYVQDLWVDLPLLSFSFLVAGGACYTIGVIFYLWDNLIYNHAIWHLFVIGGSSFHFASLMVKLNF